MGINLKIEDKTLLAHIERLRGKQTALEFIGNCFLKGLRQTDIEFQVSQSKPANAAPPAKPEGTALSLGTVRRKFRSMDTETILTALKSKDENHLVRLEVRRLIEKYVGILGTHSKKTGQPLPKHINVVSLLPIEKIALDLALETLTKGRHKARRTATLH